MCTSSSFTVTDNLDISSFTYQLTKNIANFYSDHTDSSS
jgi:hypothetical protein